MIKKHQSKEKGFTLIELLVVIAIIALLSSIVLASLNVARAKARDAQRQSDVHSVNVALEEYANDNNGNYPPIFSDTKRNSKYADDSDQTKSLSLLSLFTPIAHAQATPLLVHNDTLCANADGLAEYLVPKYIGRIPLDPTDTGTNSKTCYRYESSDPTQGKGLYGVFYTTLETETYPGSSVNKKIGFLAGGTSNNTQTSLYNACLATKKAGGAYTFPVFYNNATDPCGASQPNTPPLDTVLGTSNY